MSRTFYVVYLFLGVEDHLLGTVYCRGGSRIFLRRGCASRNDVTDGEVKNVKSECVYTKKKAFISRGGGGAHPCTLPLDPLLY